MKMLLMLIGCCLLTIAGASRFAASQFRVQPASIPSDVRLSLLDRRIQSLNFDGTPAFRAVATIAMLTSVKIEPRFLPPGHGGVSPETRIWLNVTDVSLGQAMDALVDAMNESVGRLDRLVTYDLRDSTLIIAPIQDLPNKTLLYDVHDLAPSVSISPNMPNLLAPLMLFGWWDETANFCLEPSSGLLAVTHNSRVHAQIAGYLRALRQSHPDGTGPSLLAAYCWANEAAGLEIRIYDVRDIEEKFEWNSWEPDASGVYKRTAWTGGLEALRQAMAENARSFFPRYTAGRQVFSAAGRVIVCESPENQKKVREFLETLRLRDGKEISGLRVKVTRRP